MAGSKSRDAGEHGSAGLLEELAPVYCAGEALSQNPYLLVEHAHACISPFCL
jgi:hypothetical protein